MATITDKKLPIAVPGNASMVGSYNSDDVSYMDYSPFGMQLTGRVYNNQWQKYRYGFNGKENDNEMYGPYNELDYGFRIYDPRIGRFLSVDPLTKSYPWYTPYQYAGNTPIQAIDLDGLEEWMMRQQLMLKRRAQLQLAADQSKASTTIGPSPPKTWQQNWRDDTNIFKKMLYDVANGFYTLPQQVTSSARGADYIHNIGGNVHKAHGIEGETQRVDNAVNAFSSMVPGAKAEEAGGKVLGKALGGILESKFAQKLLLGIEQKIVQQLPKLTKFETKVVNEANAILSSPEFNIIRNAQKSGTFAEVSINGTKVLFEPGLPSSGFTLMGERGFALGNEAFKSSEELGKSLLHELYRLNNSAVPKTGLGGAQATSETKAAFEFAEKASGYIKQ